MSPAEQARAEGDLTSGQVAALAGVSFRVLDHWCRAGVLRCPGHGAGTIRRWDAHDVAVVRLLAALRSGPANCPLHVLAKVARLLDDHVGERGWVVLVDDRDPAFAANTAGYVRLAPAGVATVARFTPAPQNVTPKPEELTP